MMFTLAEGGGVSCLLGEKYISSKMVLFEAYNSVKK